MSGSLKTNDSGRPWAALSYCWSPKVVLGPTWGFLVDSQVPNAFPFQHSKFEKPHLKASVIWEPHTGESGCWIGLIGGSRTGWSRIHGASLLAFLTAWSWTTGGVMIPRLWDLGPFVAAGLVSWKRVTGWRTASLCSSIDPNLLFKALRACYTFQALLGRVNTTNPRPHHTFPANSWLSPGPIW